MKFEIKKNLLWILKIKIIPEIELKVAWSGCVDSSRWPSESVGLIALTSRLLVHGSSNSGRWPYEVRTLNWVIGILGNNEQKLEEASACGKRCRRGVGGVGRHSSGRGWVTGSQGFCSCV